MDAGKDGLVCCPRQGCVCTQYTTGSCTNLHFLFSVNISRLYVTEEIKRVREDERAAVFDTDNQ